MFLHTQHFVRVRSKFYPKMNRTISLGSEAWTNLMPWRILDHVPAVKPCDLRRGIGCDATFKEQPFAIIFLSDRGLLRESRRDAVNLSARLMPRGRIRLTTHLASFANALTADRHENLTRAARHDSNRTCGNSERVSELENNPRITSLLVNMSHISNRKHGRIAG